MGLLDHSTNNLILDAVLTDAGRSKLSQNKSLSITKFALGDDEVDYTIIKKYGRAVGKEKIEKNTPIFEASTNQNIALKYRLYSRADTAQTFDTTKSVTLALQTGQSQLIDTTSQGGTNILTVVVQLKYNGNTNISTSTGSTRAQKTYDIIVPTRFLTISTDNATYGTVGAARTSAAEDDPNLTQTFIYTATPQTAAETVQFKLTSVPLDSTTLSIYGKKTTTAGTSRQVDTYVTVRSAGDTSISSTFKISIRQNT